MIEQCGLVDTLEYNKFLNHDKLREFLEITMSSIKKIKNIALAKTSWTYNWNFTKNPLKIIPLYLQNHNNLKEKDTIK